MKLRLGFTGDELKIRDILENHSGKIPAKNEKYNLADLYAEKSLTDLLNPEPKKVTKRKISDFETALKVLYSVAGKSKLDRPMDYIFYDKKNRGFVSTDAYKLVFYPDLLNEKNMNFYIFDKKEFFGRNEISGEYPDYEKVIPDYELSVKNIDLKDFLEKLNGIIETFKYTSNEQIVKLFFGDTDFYFDAQNLFDCLNVFYQFDTENIDIYFDTNPKSPLYIKACQNNSFIGLAMPLEPEYSAENVFIETINLKRVTSKEKQNILLYSELELLN